MRPTILGDGGSIGEVCQPFERLSTAVHPELGEDPFQVMLDRLRRQAELFGDGWPYGIEANRVSLDAFLETAHAQGLVSRRYSIEEIFAPRLPEGLR